MNDSSSSTVSFSPLGFGTINSIIIRNFMLNTSGGKTGIPIELKLDSKSGNSPLTLSPGSTITSKIYFSQLDYSVAYGDFKSNFNFSNTFQQRIDLAKDFPNGKLMFINPQVFISALSNIGTYLDFRIDYIKAYQNTNQTINPIFASFYGNKSTDIFLKKKPTLPGVTINMDITKLDRNFGATNMLFENDSKPDILQYNFSASVDTSYIPFDKSPSFVTSDAKIKVMIKTIIPLNFTQGSYYEFQDSIKNFFLVISNALNKNPKNYINSTSLIFNITNGLPVKTTFKIDLMDSIGKVLPTTFIKEYLIAAGKVDSNGLVQPGKETKQTVVVSMSRDQLVTLRRARTIFYKVRIEGTDINSNFHFTKTNRFDIVAGLFIQADVNGTIRTTFKK